MAERSADIVIFGAGIAGLWAFNRFKRMGYDVLLLESRTIGCGQTIASQGIIHSGLKYAFAGKINKLAQSISTMPDLWRAALKGEGPVDLSAARVNAHSQFLLIPSGFMGGLIKLVTQQTLGQSVREVPKSEWPADIAQSGFEGRVIFMNEPVLDIPSVLHALAAPYQNAIKIIDTPHDPFGFLERHAIKARHIIFTGAASNAAIAESAGHDQGLETQARPLLMGMIKNAPFELYAHMVGTSDRPVATITTHKTQDGALVWYIGGSVAERTKESDPLDVLKAMRDALEKYFPKIDFSTIEWSTLPIDRIEGKSSKDGWMPDTPTIHQHDNIFYCWPTKLTFAPLLTDRLIEKIQTPPLSLQTDWNFLPEAPFTQTPWDQAQWKKES